MADTQNATVRKVLPAGTVSTLAGLADTTGSSDGAGGAARFSVPMGVAVDTAGVVYVADTYNQLIRRIAPEGVVTTLAGLPATPGSADGAGSEARFSYPTALAVDGSGWVTVADRDNHTLRRISPAGVVATLAGLVESRGSVDGNGGGARFYAPNGVAFDAAGNAFVADFGNHTIRKVTTGGVVTTLAGQAGVPGTADGAGGGARFFGPSGVATDAGGNVYVADTYNHTIRKITAGGGVTTLAGLVGTRGDADGAGSVTASGTPPYSDFVEAATFEI